MLVNKIDVYYKIAYTTDIGKCWYHNRIKWINKYNRRLIVLGESDNMNNISSHNLQV